jgi:hypothetical protein
MEKITIHCNRQIVDLLWACFKFADNNNQLDEIEALNAEEFLSQLEGKLDAALKGS